MAISVSGYTQTDSDPSAASVIVFPNIVLADAAPATVYNWTIALSAADINSNDSALTFPQSQSSGLTITGSTTNGPNSYTVTINASGTAAQMQQFLDSSLSLSNITLGTSPQVTLSVTNGSFTGQASGSALTTTVVACFLRGTLIATPAGDIAIELLSAGDLVTMASGEARPIRWIGYRSYDAPFAARNGRVMPVCITAGALGDNAPTRDLFVSPLHGMAMKGEDGRVMLVPAEALVNGSTILRRPIEGAVEYYHIELSSSDVLLANGVPTESFVDCDSRAMFVNAAEADRLDPGTASPAWTFCAPRVTEGAELVRLQNLLQRGSSFTPGVLLGHVERVLNGRIEGWVMDQSNPAAPVALEILVDGVAVAQALANAHRQDLERAGLAHGFCGFSVAIPNDCSASACIEVRRMNDGALVPMARTDAMAA